MPDPIAVNARPLDRLDPDEVATLRALLAGGPRPGVDPRATVITEPGWVPSVSPGQVVESVWGNAVRDRLVHRFASTASRDSLWPAPPAGAMCITVDTGAMWERIGGVWQRLATMGRWEVAGTPAVPANGSATLTPAVPGSAPAMTPGFHLNGTQIVVDNPGHYRVTVTLTFQATLTASAYFIVAVQQMRAAAQVVGHEVVQGTNGQTWGNIVNDYAFNNVAAGDYFQVSATCDGTARTVQGYRSSILIQRGDGT